MQRKNLLEAFRHAGSQPSKEPDSAGPFAESEPAAVAELEKALQAPSVPMWAPWALGVAVAFVLGLAIGRRTAPVEAGASLGDGDEAGYSESTPAEVRYNGETTPPAFTEESALVPISLLDSRNRYTIIVATYGSSRREYADATMQHLADQGFEVMPLAELRGNYLVLVGAAPDVDDLRAVRSRLTRLDSWDGTPSAYADAYIEKIDDLVDR